MPNVYEKCTSQVSICQAIVSEVTAPEASASSKRVVWGFVMAQDRVGKMALIMAAYGESSLVCASSDQIRVIALRPAREWCLRESHTITQLP